MNHEWIFKLRVIWWGEMKSVAIMLWDSSLLPRSLSEMYWSLDTVLGSPAWYSWLCFQPLSFSKPIILTGREKLIWSPIITFSRPPLVAQGTPLAHSRTHQFADIQSAGDSRLGSSVPHLCPRAAAHPVTVPTMTQVFPVSALGVSAVGLRFC